MQFALVMKIPSEKQDSRFRSTSCLRKKRFTKRPHKLSLKYRAYKCDFCNGWHLTSKREW
jgi:hypothetical protein